MEFKKDFFGNKIEVGSQVIVPDPDMCDVHETEFVGTIVSFKSGGDKAIVEDSDGVLFEIECGNLELY